MMIDQPFFERWRASGVLELAAALGIGYEADRRPTLQLFVDRLPRPGDYLDVNFGLYRFVRVWPDGAETVLERVKQPSRN